MTSPPATHRTAALLLIVAVAERGLSQSRGNLNEVGLACFALVLIGLSLVLFLRTDWQGCSDTVGGFPTWQVGLPCLFFFVFFTSAGDHVLVFSPEPVRILLKMITLAAGVLALPAIALAVPRWRQRLGGRARTVLTLLPLLPAIVFFALVPLASRLARIDVFHFQDQAAAALLHGINPYTILFQDTYGSPDFYPSGVPDAYPYPPLSLVFAVIGQQIGDVRWPLIACHAITALLLYGTARARTLPAFESVMLAVLFFYMPHAPFVGEQAWTDPTVTLMLAAMSWLLAQRKERAALWAGGLALALKQTMVLLLPPLWALWRRIPRPGWVALAVPGAVSYGLFLLWDGGALWNDVVAFHLGTPFRGNSLTLSAYLNYIGFSPLPGWLSVVGIVGGSAGAVVAQRRLAAGPPSDAPRVSMMFAGLAFAFLVTLWLSKHAFMNYYYLVQFALVAALIWSRIADVEAGEAQAA